MPCLSQSSSIFSRSSRMPTHCSQSSASRERRYRYKIHERIEVISTRKTAIYDDKVRDRSVEQWSKKAFFWPYLWRKKLALSKKKKIPMTDNIFERTTKSIKIRTNRMVSMLVTSRVTTTISRHLALWCFSCFLIVQVHLCVTVWTCSEMHG